MGDNKKKIISYLLRQMPQDEREEFERTSLTKPKEKELLKKYDHIINQIDLIYSRKIIAEALSECHFTEKEMVNTENIKTEVKLMKKASSNWMQYLIMILISLFVSFLVFSFFGGSDEEDSIQLNKDKSATNLVVDSIKTDNKLLTDDDIPGTDIMGIAINKTGFYVLPYSISGLKGVFGSNNSMSNNLPLNIIWDDKELGLAVAEFPDENLGKLPSIPYSFSKNDFFLGEDLFFVFSNKSEMIINRGIVIEDKSGANSMKVHLSLANEVYGAVVLDNSGEVVGICEKRDKEGNVKVVKSIALIQMVKEMNLDKGLSYISLPSQNYLRSKSNAQRIESFSPFMAWFSTK